MGGGAEDRDPEQRPAAELNPIAHVLQSTYDAENHDSLGSDLTGLMLQLARVDDTIPPPVPPPRVAPPSVPRHWFWRLLGR